MMEQKCILVDIDHVLRNSFRRDHMLAEASKGAWDDYHSAAEEDAPLDDIVSLVRTMHASGVLVVCLTAVPAKWRQLTMRWMAKHNIPVDDLLMRPDDEFRPSPPMKMDLALAYFGSEQAIRDRVLFLLEDRDDVCATFRAIGITVCQVFGREK